MESQILSNEIWRKSGSPLGWSLLPVGWTDDKGRERPTLVAPLGKDLTLNPSIRNTNFYIIVLMLMLCLFRKA